jgi:hypothetical protein
MKKHHLTFEEQYDLGYAEGRRIGSIQSVREILLNCIKKCGEEQGTQSSKSLIMKIKRETDVRFLYKVMFATIEKKITISELEMRYDMLFLANDERGEDERDL